MSAFLPLQDLENLPHLEDPCFVPYQGHNAFREKYFSGLNKKGGKQEDDKTNASAETLIWFQVEDERVFCSFSKDNETDCREENSNVIVSGKQSDNFFLMLFKSS